MALAGIGRAMLTMLILASSPALASDDPLPPGPGGGESVEFEDDILDGTGSGGGPAMIWFSQDLGALNTLLAGEDLAEIPQMDLYWGGAGWGSIGASDGFFVGLGGGGFGGSQERRRGDRLSKWTHAAGYFAVKGIYPVSRRLFLEGGLQMGGGVSRLWVEKEKADSGIIEIHLRGERPFLLLKPHVGLDLRLARWLGFLFEGGYCLTGGDWKLEGDEALIAALGGSLPDGRGPYASVLLRFGI